MFLKLRKNSLLRNCSGCDLYQLEQVLGNSCGHGSGFNGEDIEWKIRKTKYFYDNLWIQKKGSQLEIIYKRWYEDDAYHVEALAWSNLPSKWRKKLFKALRPHVLGRFPKEFYK